jgi:HPt (histidine-containing phosphotransfer) domain-containing protein
VLEKWIEAGPVRVRQPEAENMPAAAVHFRTLQEIAAGDEQLIEALLATFIRMADEAMTELHKALADSDWVQLGEQAHKFKSSARTIGAARLGELCEALECNRNWHDQREARGAVNAIATELQRVLGEVEARLGQPLAAAG